ncbi:MAG: hypothetical protein AABX36_02860, partial [Candidatus Thermoplasmatota archaeon]
MLTQALLAVPLFPTRFRWNAARSLAILRFHGGKKVPFHLQRYRSDDLLTAVFPGCTACLENRPEDMPIPDHPLVRQTIWDCLHEAMDVGRWVELLRDIEAGRVELVARDTREPSPFSHQLLNANPYAFLDDAQRVVVSRMRERAIQFHETLRASVQLGQDLGADAASLGAALRDGNAAMDNGRYADMIGIRERTRKDVVAATENLFNLVKQKVVQVKNLKINIDEMRDILKRAKTSLSVEDHLEAIRFMQEANEKANRILDLYRATHHAISSSAALVAEAKKRDVDVTKVLEILLEAKRAFERLEFEKALELANRAKVETEKLMALYTSAQRLMSSRERLEVATRLGIEAPALVELLNTAKDAMKAKEYERASRLTETLETELTEQIRNRIASLLTSMESLIVGAEGSVILGLSGKVDKVRGLVESQQYGQAADLVLQMRVEFGKAKKLMEDALIALKQARDAIADVETMQIDPTSAKKLLEKAEKAHKAGKLEEAVDLATKTISELEAETERLVATTMKRFEESILIAKRDGIDTRSAEKLFERAKEFLKGRKFRQALAVAVQSETEPERVALQQDMASKALQTIEAKVAEFGQPVPPIQALLKEAKEASGGRDYVRALDLAIRAGDDFARFRETAEEASDSRGRAGVPAKTQRFAGRAEPGGRDHDCRRTQFALPAGNCR